MELGKLRFSCEHPTCPNKYYYPIADENYTNKRFFTFPRNKELQTRWKTICGIDEKTDCNTGGHYLCECHFASKDFRNEKRTKLHPKALPKRVVAGHKKPVLYQQKKEPEKGRQAQTQKKPVKNGALRPLTTRRRAKKLMKKSEEKQQQQQRRKSTRIRIRNKRLLPIIESKPPTPKSIAKSATATTTTTTNSGYGSNTSVDNGPTRKQPISSAVVVSQQNGIEPKKFTVKNLVDYSVFRDHCYCRNYSMIRILRGAANHNAQWRASSHAKAKVTPPMNRRPIGDHTYCKQTGKMQTNSKTVATDGKLLIACV